MNDMTIAEFCDKHEACEAGREWALTNCKTMQEVWQTSKYSWLVWLATRCDVLTAKELRLFAVFNCRDVWHLLTDERSRNAVEVVERYIVNRHDDTADLSDACHVALAVPFKFPLGKHRTAARAAVFVGGSPRSAAQETALQTLQAAAADAPAGEAEPDWTVPPEEEKEDWNYRGWLAAQRKADWLRANVTPDFTKKGG
jgi:hypothetical protein